MAPVRRTVNLWTMTAANGLTAGSTHGFQVAYMTDRRASVAAVGGHDQFDLERL